MKNLLTFLLCTLMTGISTAQYDQIFQLTSDDYINNVTSICGDGQGNTYSAGSFENSFTIGPFTLTSESGYGNGTGFLAQFNAVSDSWVWANKITLVSYYAWSYIGDITSDASGNTYVVGGYQGIIKFDDITLSSTQWGNSTDLFVAKMNANGTWAWAKSFGTKAGPEYGRTITLDANNNIYVGGEFTNKVFQCATVEDIYLAKLNSSGTALWQKRIAPKPATCFTHAAIKDIALDAAGNVYLTGNYSGTYVFGKGASLSITDNGSTDIFVAKFNNSGTTQWVRSSGSPEWDKVETIALDAVGQVYIAGQMKHINPYGFVSKYNSAGTPVWTVNPFPNSAEFPGPWVRRIIHYGNSLLAADIKIGLKTLSLTDGSVLSSDSLTGNPVLLGPFLGSPFGIRDLETDGTGFVVLIHAECGTSDLGNITISASCTECTDGCYSDEYYSHDIIVVRGGEPPILYMRPDVDIKPDVSHVTALSELDLYPNPATNQVNIQLPEIKSEGRLMIRNHLGKIVWSEKMDEGKSLTIIHLSVEDFPQGVYFYSLIEEDSIMTKSFLISD